MTRSHGTPADATTAAVVEPNRIVTATARHTSLMQGEYEHLLADPVALLAGATGRFTVAGEGTVIVSTMAQVDIVGQTMARGWTTTRRGDSTGWYTFTRTDFPTIHLGIWDRIRREDAPILPPEWEPFGSAQQLARFRDLTGTCFRMTPGVTGLAMVKRWYPRSAPTWKWSVPELSTMVPPSDIVWSRPLTAAERNMGDLWIHQFDTNKQYLAAAGAAMLSWDGLEPAGAEAPDPTRAGLWHIRVPARNRRPPMTTALESRRMDNRRRAWVTTPIIADLLTTNTEFEVLDTLLAPTNRAGLKQPGTARLLRPPVEHLRDAMMRQQPPDNHPRHCGCLPCGMARTLKRSWNDAVGIMSTPTAQVSRPDWAWTIRDLARILLLRKARAGLNDGLRPVRIHADSLYYVSPDPDPKPIGDALGAVRTGQMGRLRWVKTDRYDNSRNRAARKETTNG